MKIFKNAVSIAIAALFTFSVILGSFTVTAKTEQTYVSADQFRSSEKIFFQDADRIVDNCKFHVIQQFAFTNDNKYIFATQEGFFLRPLNRTTKRIPCIPVSPCSKCLLTA